MIHVTRSIKINESEIEEEFFRSSGPGGQNVNKVATAVRLRFDVANSRSLPEDVRKRLIPLAGNRITSSGVLVIEARRLRTQERNRDDALARLVELVRKAAEKPRVRRPTRPTLTSRKLHLEAKRHRSEVKRRRHSVKPC